jgi:protein kinase-like protein
MPPELVSGSVVAGFRIAKALDGGSTGSVYLAVGRDGGQVALKVLSPQLAADERFRRRFLRESQLAQRLDHPHVVATVTSGEEEGRLYLATAYVDGADLREILQREGRLEPERALRLLGQVADALDAAHRAGLVHRDVKPGNILVAAGSDERALLCDFGLARHVSSVSSLTGDRGFVGTIDYVSPEQIEGAGLDGRADVYSLACVLFECLAGRRPFERDSELAVVFAHLNEPPPRLSHVRPELPAALGDVIASALAKKPAERVGSCRALIDQAEAALHGRPVRWLPGFRRRRVMLAAIALLAAAGAGVSWAVESDRGPASPGITPTAIGGAELGLKASAYEKLFGRPWAISRQSQSDHRILTFPTRGIAVYFKGLTDTAVEIITWNGALRTAEGVGPCTAIRRAKAVYGRAMVPSPFNTQEGKTYAYVVEKNLIFAANGLPPNPSPTVTAVALFYSDAPDADKAGGALSFGGYLAIDAATECETFTATT